MSINQKQWKNKKYLYYFDVTKQINHLPQIYVLSWSHRNNPLRGFLRITQIWVGELQ